MSVCWSVSLFFSNKPSWERNQKRKGKAEKAVGALIRAVAIVKDNMVTEIHIQLIKVVGPLTSVRVGVYCV